MPQDQGNNRSLMVSLGAADSDWQRPSFTYKYTFKALTVLQVKGVTSYQKLVYIDLVERVTRLYDDSMSF
jgi:hypothetical protein